MLCTTSCELDAPPPAPPPPGPRIGPIGPTPDPEPPPTTDDDCLDVRSRQWSPGPTIDAVDVTPSLETVPAPVFDVERVLARTLPTEIFIPEAVRVSPLGSIASVRNAVGTNVEDNVLIELWSNDGLQTYVHRFSDLSDYGDLAHAELKDSDGDWPQLDVIWARNFSDTVVHERYTMEGWSLLEESAGGDLIAEGFALDDDELHMLYRTIDENGADTHVYVEQTRPCGTAVGFELKGVPDSSHLAMTLRADGEPELAFLADDELWVGRPQSAQWDRLPLDNDLVNTIDIAHDGSDGVVVMANVIRTDDDGDGLTLLHRRGSAWSEYRVDRTLPACADDETHPACAHDITYSYARSNLAQTPDAAYVALAVGFDLVDENDVCDEANGRSQVRLLRIDGAGVVELVVPGAYREITTLSLAQSEAFPDRLHLVFKEAGALVDDGCEYQNLLNRVTVELPSAVTSRGR